MHMTKEGIFLNWEDFSGIDIRVDRHQEEVYSLFSTSVEVLPGHRTADIAFTAKILEHANNPFDVTLEDILGNGPKIETKTGWMVVNPITGPLRWTLSWTSPVMAWREACHVSVGKPTRIQDRFQYFLQRKREGHYVTKVTVNYVRK